MWQDLARAGIMVGRGQDNSDDGEDNGEVIAAALPVTIEFMSLKQAASIVDLSKLPEDASETLRIVRVDEYDDCACIGAHVANTSEIGEFHIISHDF